MFAVCYSIRLFILFLSIYFNPKFSPSTVLVDFPLIAPPPQLLLYVANYRPATYYEALRVLLNFMQIMALMASLRVQWPSIVR